tara:strand:- start:124 stop:633 length:510 start_codon:yes stop_codon:yes gene_type:complete
MSLVDPYHDRVFRNGRLYGVNYNEQTMQPTYTDISPFGGGRKAGEGIGLEPDVVIYMGKAAQGMPQNESMDRRIADGFMQVFGQLLGQPRTMEYREERDGPLNIQPIGPYNPDTDKSEVIQLGEISHGGSTPYKPMDSESMRRLREPGSPMPKDVRDEILRNLAGMRKA